MSAPPNVSYSVPLLSSTPTGTVARNNGFLTDSSYVWFGNATSPTSICQLNKFTLTLTKKTTTVYSVNIASRLSSIYNDTIYTANHPNGIGSFKTNTFTGTIQTTQNSNIVPYSIAYYDGNYLWANPVSGGKFTLVRYTMSSTDLSTAVTPGTNVIFPGNSLVLGVFYRLIGNSKYIWALESSASSTAYVHQILKSTATIINTISINATGADESLGLGGICVDNSYVWVTGTKSVSPATISQILITDGSVNAPLSVIKCPIINTANGDISQMDSIYSDNDFVYVTAFGSANIFVFKIGSPTAYYYTIYDAFLGAYSFAILGDLNYLWQTNVYANNSNSLINQVNIYGLKNVMMLDNSGAVWVAGFNRNGQLGLGNTTSINTLLVKPTLSITGNVIGFGGGMNTAYILSDDGTMYASGLNISGSMLNSSGTDSNTFIACTSLSGLLQSGEKIIKSITNGVDNTYYAFLTSLGNVYSMGVGNGGNQFGNSAVSTAPAVTNAGTFYLMTNSTGKTPVDIQVMLNNVANQKALFVLMSDGTLYGCGYAAYLGIGTTSGNQTTLTQLFGSSYTYPNLTTGETISQISASRFHVLALTTLGNIYTLSILTSTTSGFSVASGIGGYSTTVPQWVKVDTSAASTKINAGILIKRVSAGNQYSVALFSDGSLWGCGENTNGQLGKGNYTSPVTFSSCLAFPSGPTKYASAVQCLNSNTVVLASDGTVYACGFNDYGQLGQNNTTFTNSLVKMNATGNTPITNIKTLNINYAPIVPGVAPSAPTITNIYSTDGSNQTITFTQPDASPAISGYSYSVNGGSYVLTAYTNSPFTINNAPGTSVAIKSINLVGTSGASNLITVGTPPTITAITLGLTSIIVTFTAGSLGSPAFSSKQPTISGYKVSTDNGLSFQTCNTSPATISGLNQGTQYNVLIQSYDPSGSWYSYNTSNVQTITTYRTGSTPSILSLSRIFNSQTTLSLDFTDSSNGNPGIQKYQYSLNSGAFQDASGISSPIIIRDLSAGTPYSVVIKAVSIGNTWTSLSSAASASVSTNRIGTTPSSLVLSAVNGSQTSLKLSFTGSTSGVPALSGYKYSKTGNSNDYSDATVIDNSFIIQSLTPGTQYTIYLKAVSNNDWETGVSSATASTYKLGSVPNIIGIDSSINAIIVNFEQTTLSVPNSTYYYSYSADGSNRVAASLLTPTSFVISTTEPRTVYVIADSSAGTLISTPGVLGTPYVAGNKPVITSVVPGINKFTVTFSATVSNPVSSYYYSYSNTGSPRYGPFENTFDTNTDLSYAIPYTIYVVAVNAAGIAVSDGSSATPLMIGNAPVINSITPGFKSLTINFSNSTNANPAPYYYYSYNGGQTFINSTYNTNTPILIPDLTDSSYTIQLKGVSALGDTAISTYTGAVPNLLGSKPLVSLTNGRGKLTVNSYSQVTPGTYTTTWHYYLNDISYAVPTTNGNPFDISGTTLTNTPYSFYMVARNPAGDVSSNLETGSVFGSDPSFSVLNGTGKITVTYSQTTPGTNSTSWYYYLNNNSYSAPASPFDISGALLTVSPYSIYMVVNNPAGDLSTGTVSGSVLGSPPSITNVTPGINTLAIDFSQNIVGTTPTTYYYSTDGTTPLGTGTSMSPLVISNISTATTFYLIANNSAGNVRSLLSASGTPNLRGSIPTISSVSPIDGSYSSLKVYFADSSGGRPALSTYQYSFNGSDYYNATGTTSPITISDLSAGTSYLVRLRAISDSAWSSEVSTAPLAVSTNKKGDAPYNVVVTPVTGTETSLSVSFADSLVGVPPPTKYQYLLNGSGSFIDVSANNPFIIQNLYTDTSYSVVLKAVSGTAWSSEVSSASTAVKTYKLGNAPVITDISSGLNSIIVYFNDSSGGNPNSYTYYYSLDGGNYMIANSTTSPITIRNLTIEREYMVRLVSYNSAGISPPSNALGGTPIYYNQNPVVFTIAPPRVTNSVTGSAISQDRRAFVNMTFNAATATATERSIMQKKTQTGVGKLNGSDVVISRRVKAIGQTEFGKK